MIRLVNWHFPLQVETGSAEFILPPAGSNLQLRAHQANRHSTDTSWHYPGCINLAVNRNSPSQRRGMSGIKWHLHDLYKALQDLGKLFGAEACTLENMKHPEFPAKLKMFYFDTDEH